MEYATVDIQAIRDTTANLETWAVEQAAASELARPETALGLLGRVLAARSEVSWEIERTLKLRRAFPQLLEKSSQREAARRYQATLDELIDLEGRLRFLETELLEVCVDRFATDEDNLLVLIDLLRQHDSSVGAGILLSTFYEETDYPSPVPGPVRQRCWPRLLRLLAAAGSTVHRADLADLLSTESRNPSLVVALAVAMDRLGWPQVPRPNQDPTLPLPEITAEEAYEILADLNEAGLSLEANTHRNRLLKSLRGLSDQGETEAGYQLGGFKVRAGDWLLMRNPSPYNLFTDLSPGLFTHVGVITTEQGGDGRRRFVVVDLPERGTRIPATNIDTFVKRTRHFLVLRDPDSEAAGTMAEVARSIIGNKSRFDLNFRTTAIAGMKGQALAGREIHGYCAGLLLLCAQETKYSRSKYFPFEEGAASGETKSNLRALGVTLGDHFISPTGALYGGRLEIVGRSEMMYQPERHIEEEVFDRFAENFRAKQLSSTADLFQTVRLGLARMSENNPLLAQALAKSADVNAEMDLVAAAKVATVIEHLDSAAYGASEEFVIARESLLAGPLKLLREEGFDDEDLAEIQAYRQRHEDLYRRLLAQQLSVRDLRDRLVEYYVHHGRRQVDALFENAPRK